MTAWLPVARSQPFSLSLDGVPGDLLTLPTDRGGHNPYLPYVLPESVSLETTSDELGGQLSFTVYQDRTPAAGPWWATVADNALVEFHQNKSVDPVAGSQQRLFVGFLDSVEAALNPGGAGTVATVTAVSTNAVLDRIVVRRFGKRQTGLGVARITIKRGTDRDQIRAILKYVGGARRYGKRTVFDPGDHRAISATTGTLPALEVQAGSLRTALESVQEAAQDQDGYRRAFHVDPATGRLVYGRADAGSTVDATAPWEIVTDPAAEATISPASGDTLATVLATPGIATFHRFAETGTGPYKNAVPAAKRPLNLVWAGASGTYGTRVGGPYDASEPDNYAIAFTAATKYLANNTATWAFPAAGRPLSVSLWYMAGLGTLASFGGNPGGGWAGWAVSIEAGVGTRDVYLDTYAAGARTRQLLASVAASTWHHLVVAWGASGVTVVHDGASASYAINRPTQGTVLSLGALGDDSDHFTSRVAGFAVFGATLTVAEARAIRNAGIWAKAPSRIAVRGLELVSDHSRIAKTALFMTADSTADRDNDADPYMRSYDALRNAANTGPAFAKRHGPRFEAMVDAPTARATSRTKRIAQVDQLARAYFTARRQPQTGGSFTVRGAGPEANQRYGFSGGWRVAGTGYAYVAAGWRPGQFVRITAPALGFAGLYRIESVTAGFEPGGFVRTFRVEFERRPRNRLGRFINQE